MKVAKRAKTIDRLNSQFVLVAYVLPIVFRLYGVFPEENQILSRGLLSCDGQQFENGFTNIDIVGNFFFTKLS